MNPASNIRPFLAKFAAEGNSVVALIDEGCGKSEDLVAMMSIADGVIKIETEKDRQLMNIVKHPSCFFTTGFLNGLFSAVKKHHIREIKCVAAGDPYCEWEII